MEELKEEEEWEELHGGLGLEKLQEDQLEGQGWEELLEGREELEEGWEESQEG